MPPPRALGAPPRPVGGAASSVRLHAHARARQAAARPTAAPATTARVTDPLPAATDDVVIGAGLGGLSCAALLAKYGLDVAVVEAHDTVGGAAHSFNRGGYTFESGPSLFSGLATSGPAANPMAHVLTAVGAHLPTMEYDSWLLRLPGLPPLRAGVAARPLTACWRPPALVTPPPWPSGGGCRRPWSRWRGRRPLSLLLLSAPTRAQRSQPASAAAPALRPV